VSKLPSPGHAELTEPSRKAVDAAIAKAIADLKSYRQAEQIQTSTPEGCALDKIVEKMKNAGRSEVGFRKAILSLLKLPEFDMPDGDILSKYAESKPWPGNRSWSDVLSKYRGIIMHQGYFDFRSADEEIVEIFRIMLHLHDIVVRLILKMLRYQGTYHPSVLQVVATDIPVDWVRPDTPARKLGYLR
jgi:hypothetical protein